MLYVHPFEVCGSVGNFEYKSPGSFPALRRSTQRSVRGAADFAHNTFRICHHNIESTCEVGLTTTEASRRGSRAELHRGTMAALVHLYVALTKVHRQ